jgi:hypothetical protein
VTEPLEEAAEELAATVRALNGSIERANDVRRELDRLVKRSRTNRKWILLLAASLVLDLALTVSMVFVVGQADRNTHRIDTIVQVQHDAALCPLYRLFISSDTPANADRAAAQGQDRAERARQFAIIRASYAALHCQDK